MGRPAKRLRQKTVTAADLNKMSTVELAAYAKVQMDQASKQIEKLEKTVIELARLFTTQLPFTRRLARAGKRKVS